MMRGSKDAHNRVKVKYRGLANILPVRVVQHILEAERMGVDGLLLWSWQSGTAQDRGHTVRLCEDGVCECVLTWNKINQSGINTTTWHTLSTVGVKHTQFHYTTCLKCVKIVCTMHSFLIHMVNFWLITDYFEHTFSTMKSTIMTTPSIITSTLRHRCQMVRRKVYLGE